MKVQRLDGYTIIISSITPTITGVIKKEKEIVIETADGDAFTVEQGEWKDWPHWLLGMAEGNGEQSNRDAYEEAREREWWLKENFPEEFYTIINQGGPYQELVHGLGVDHYACVRDAFIPPEQVLEMAEEAGMQAEQLPGAVIQIKATGTGREIEVQQFVWTLRGRGWSQKPHPNRDGVRHVGLSYDAAMIRRRLQKNNTLNWR